MSNFKRGYLNSEERNFYMISKSFIQMINGERNLNNKMTNEIWVEWSKKGMFTQLMQKSIKLVKTYLTKFCEEIEENIDEAEKAKLKKQLLKFDYRLVDDYTVQKLYRDYKDKLKYIVMEREKFDPIIEELAEIKCVGCKCDYKTCFLYKAFDDISLVRVDEEENCPYAVDLSKCKPEEVKRIEKIKENLKVKNQFRK
ncbi:MULTISPECIES: DUF5651 domain-containing protein [unclassified Clostridium]|uniref:DUF5651 domain-containing protein n=1 Tax=unclassified Clostridium TaxID=2614128 RepID=UPI0002973166|nr:MULTISPECIES: DUF5651 domain-containing protein [unclassified Clostridium]EKQ50292.1 MAG: hypothetical protein A370_05738 [Clostridium sp. Maddingley MBC34-26]